MRTSSYRAKQAYRPHYMYRQIWAEFKQSQKKFRAQLRRTEWIRPNGPETRGYPIIPPFHIDGVARFAVQAVTLSFLLAAFGLTSPVLV